MTNIQTNVAKSMPRKKEYPDTRPSDNVLLNTFIHSSSEEERNEAWRLFWEGDQQSNSKSPHEGYKKLTFDIVRKENILDPEEADDAVGDIQKKIVKNIHEFDQNTPFIPWLKKISVNHCKNVNKKIRNNKTKSIGWENYTQSSNEATVAYYREPAKTPSPLENAINGQLKMQILAVLDELNEKDREIIMCRFFEHMSYNEIAEALGIKIGTVMSRLYNAKESFKEVFSAINED